MEELAAALAAAIRAGSALAPGALLGYYIVRSLEAVASPLAFVGAVSIISHTIRKCVLRYADVEEKRPLTPHRHSTEVY